MIHAAFALLVFVWVTVFVFHLKYTRARGKAQTLEEYEQFHKKVFWTQIGTMILGLATGFSGGQLYLHG